MNTMADVQEAGCVSRFPFLQGSRARPYPLVVAIPVPPVDRSQPRGAGPVSWALELGVRRSLKRWMQPGSTGYDRGNIERKPAKEAFCNGENWLDRW